MAGCPAHRHPGAGAGNCNAGGGVVQMGVGRAAASAQICSASNVVPTTGGRLPSRHLVPTLAPTCPQAASAPHPTAAAWPAFQSCSHVPNAQCDADGWWPGSCVVSSRPTPPTQPHPARPRVHTRRSTQADRETWPSGACQLSSCNQPPYTPSSMWPGQQAPRPRGIHSCSSHHQQVDSRLPAALHHRRRPHVLCMSVTTQERQSQLHSSRDSTRKAVQKSQPAQSAEPAHGVHNSHEMTPGGTGDVGHQNQLHSHDSPQELQPQLAAETESADSIGTSHNSPNGNSQAGSRQVHVARQRAQQAPVVGRADNPPASFEPQQSTYEPIFVTQSEEADEAPSIPVLGPRTPRRGKLKRPQRPSPTPTSPPPPQASDSTTWEPQPLQPTLPAFEPAGPTSPEPSEPQLRATLFDRSLEGNQGASPSGDSPDIWQGDDDEQDAYMRQAYRSARQLRIPTAVPLQLVPLSPKFKLLDPDTGVPLAAAGKEPNDISQQGSVTQAVRLPLLGPWLMSNYVPAFPASDAYVDYLVAPEPNVPLRLGIRVQYVAQRDQADIELQGAEQSWMDQSFSSDNGMGKSAAQPLPVAAPRLFNISRRRRGQERLSVIVVSRRLSDSAVSQQAQQPTMGSQQAEQPTTGSQQADEAARSQQADERDEARETRQEEQANADVLNWTGIRQVARKGVQHFLLETGNVGFELQPGDIITLGKLRGAPKFRVELQTGGTHSSTDALDSAVQQYCSASSSTDLQAPRSGISTRLGMPAGSRRPEGSAAALAALAAAAEAGQLLELQQISQLARVNPAAAQVAYRTAVLGPHRHNAFAWIAWAQLCARRRRLKQARDLFRAAVAAAAPAAHALELDAGPYLDSHSEMQLADSVDSMHTQAANHTGGRASTANTAQLHDEMAMDPARPVPVYQVGNSYVALVQSLYQWGRFEWDVARATGAARHLWRAAADVALCHPDGQASGGLGVVLHTWALSELNAMNIVNARVVVAEALAKCPYDQPLWVLAANVELKGGNHDLAKTFCLRAYELDRTDKHLYLVWPSVMAALGQRDKARVLFERGRDYHPNNTKIMNAYAEFLAKSNDIEGKAAAAELHELALTIDPHSWTTMHNRAAWARLEMDVGHYETARKLLMEGLSYHPNHLPSLLALTRLHRKLQNLAEAQRVLHSAKQLTHAFDTDYLEERFKVLKALGEFDMARALNAHLHAVTSWQASKRGYLNTTPAWRLYYENSKGRQRQQMAVAALERKRELGWLQAQGIPGPKGARRGNVDSPPVPWVPLPSLLSASAVAGPVVDTSDSSEGQEEPVGEPGVEDVVLPLQRSPSNADVPGPTSDREDSDRDDDPEQQIWRDQWRD